MHRLMSMWNDSIIELKQSLRFLVTDSIGAKRIIVLEILYNLTKFQTINR